MLSSEKTILIVDDDLTNRLVLRALIGEAGYHSIEVENGEQAVHAVEQNHIDIILLDVMMPVMRQRKLSKADSSDLYPLFFSLP